ncbi:MAG: DUF5996 family protein [Rhodothermales bacterium]
MDVRTLQLLIGLREAGGCFLSIAATSEFAPTYGAICQAADPAVMLLDFLQSTYEAAADLGWWDCIALERLEDPRTSV